MRRARVHVCGVHVSGLHLHGPSLSGGIPILMQEAAAGVPGWGSRLQRGSCSCMRMRGLERASEYSRLHRSCSRASHSSRHSWRWRGVPPAPAASHRGKTWKQSERTANWEHWSDIWAEVPIMVKAAVGG